LKGETPMSLTDLGVTMALFGIAVIIVSVVGFFLFLRWDKKDKLRRGRQIAMANLEEGDDDAMK
jgi:hypothetical protein